MTPANRWSPRFKHPPSRGVIGWDLPTSKSDTHTRQTPGWPCRSAVRDVVCAVLLPALRSVHDVQTHPEPQTRWRSTTDSRHHQSRNRPLPGGERRPRHGRIPGRHPERVLPCAPGFTIGFVRPSRWRSIASKELNGRPVALTPIRWLASAMPIASHTSEKTNGFATLMSLSTRRRHRRSGRGKSSPRHRVT